MVNAHGWASWLGGAYIDLLWLIVFLWRDTACSNNVQGKKKSCHYLCEVSAGKGEKADVNHIFFDFRRGKSLLKLCSDALSALAGLTHLFDILPSWSTADDGARLGTQKAEGCSLWPPRSLAGVLCVPEVLGQWSYITDTCLHWLTLHAGERSRLLVGCKQCEKMSSMITAANAGSADAAASGQGIDSVSIKERDPRVTFWSLGKWLCARCRAHEPWQWCVQVCRWASKKDPGICAKADKAPSATARGEEQAAERCRLSCVTWCKRQGSLGVCLQATMLVLCFLKQPSMHLLQLRFFFLEYIHKIPSKISVAAQWGLKSSVTK